MTSTTTAEAGYELDEHDGITWFAWFQDGRTWAIVWQPARAEDDIRAWPVVRNRPGRTAHRGHAADADAARAEAHRIASLVAAGKKG